MTDERILLYPGVLVNYHFRGRKKSGVVCKVVETKGKVKYAVSSFDENFYDLDLVEPKDIVFIRLPVIKQNSRSIRKEWTCYMFYHIVSHNLLKKGINALPEDLVISRKDYQKMEEDYLKECIKASNIEPEDKK